MAWKNKVVWSEGMLLQPQHLQQHDRYWQSQVEARVANLRPYSSGFADLKIDEQQLALGKIALTVCTAVLPDGTPFSLPADDDLPLPLDVPSDARNVIVVLALPVRRHGMAEVGNQLGADNFARHRSDDYEVWDSNGLDNSALMQVGKLRLRLALASEVLQGHSTLGVGPTTKWCLIPTIARLASTLERHHVWGHLQMSWWACCTNAAMHWRAVCHSQARAASVKLQTSCCCSC